MNQDTCSVCSECACDNERCSAIIASIEEMISDHNVDTYIEELWP